MKATQAFEQRTNANIEDFVLLLERATKGNQVRYTDFHRWIERRVFEDDLSQSENGRMSYLLERMGKSLSLSQQKQAFLEQEAAGNLETFLEFFDSVRTPPPSHKQINKRPPPPKKSGLLSLLFPGNKPAEAKGPEKSAAPAWAPDFTLFDMRWMALLPAYDQLIPTRDSEIQKLSEHRLSLYKVFFALRAIHSQRQDTQELTVVCSNGTPRIYRGKTLLPDQGNFLDDTYHAAMKHTSNYFQLDDLIWRIERNQEMARVFADYFCGVQLQLSQAANALKLNEKFHREDEKAELRATNKSAEVVSSYCRLFEEFGKRSHGLNNGNLRLAEIKRIKEALLTYMQGMRASPKKLYEVEEFLAYITDAEDAARKQNGITLRIERQGARITSYDMPQLYTADAKPITQLTQAQALSVLNTHISFWHFVLSQLSTEDKFSALASLRSIVKQPSKDVLPSRAANILTGDMNNFAP